VSNYDLPIDSYDYNRMFKYTRELLTRKPVEDLLKKVFEKQLQVTPELAKKLNIPVGGIKQLSEHQFVLLLQMNEELWPMLDQYIKEVPNINLDSEKQVALRKVWREKFEKILNDPKVMKKFTKFNNPLEPRILQTANGSAGYKNLEFYANTVLKYEDGKLVQPSNLKQKWIDFINKAEKQIVLNVYDFDLMEVADALVVKAEQGLDVRIGIDDKVIHERPEVKAVFDRLDDVSKKLEKSGKGSMKVFAVNAVGLNHQKLCARDWEIKGKGAVLSSSGNLTQSCSGPEGDALGKVKSKYSIPNANHMVIMDSDVTAQLVNHELTKTLDMKLRGREYPLSGAWMVYGEGKGVPVAKRDHFIMAFSPNGALGDINEQMISEMIRRRNGELKALQFAFSSPSVDNALYEAAIKEIKKTGSFNFKSVGDTPFAGREWSVFLNMIGYTKDETTGIYSIDTKSRWNKLPEIVKAKIRQSVLAAPSVYGEKYVDLPDGTKLKLTSKIHHKVLMDSEKGFFGTSFNFSNNAEGNNEAIILFKDKKVINDGQAMFRGMEEEANKTLEDVILKKNDYLKLNPKPIKGTAGGNCDAGLNNILKSIKEIKKNPPQIDL
jgi:phosphatidylserine/phosphatidylglycerophosphate/cardiolipin synthase-like enzyme